MTATVMLALTMGVGVVMGVLLLLAALAAGRSPLKWHYGLGGVAWGFALSWLILTDCQVSAPGNHQFANIAFPVYFAGLIAWPVALAWGQANWGRRWLFAQLILILSLPPAFMLAVLGGLCNMT